MRSYHQPAQETILQGTYADLARAASLMRDWGPLEHLQASRFDWAIFAR